MQTVQFAFHFLVEYLPNATAVLIRVWTGPPHISAVSNPMHFMFGCRLGFWGTVDVMALFPV